MNILKRNNAIAKLNELKSRRENVLFLDTETVGGFGEPAVFEIAIVDIDGKTVFHSYLKPFTGLDNLEGFQGDASFFVDKPEYKDIHDELYYFLKEKDVLIYNKSFDIRVLNLVSYFYFLDSPLANSSVHCMMQLRRDIEGGKSTPLNGDHTAVGDCIVMLTMFNELASMSPLDDAIASDESIENLLIMYDEANRRVKDAEQYKENISNQIKQRLLSGLTPGVTIKNEYSTENKKISISAEVGVNCKVDPSVNISELDPRVLKLNFDRFSASKIWKESNEKIPGIIYDRIEKINRITIKNNFE